MSSETETLETINRIARIVTGQNTKLKSGVCCCECNKEMTGVLGEGKPISGAAILYGECGCLSIFDEDLGFRHPTDEEIFIAAKDPMFQTARRMVLEVIAKRRKRESEGQ